MGVSRAMSKAEELSKKGEMIYTWGPLIHNPQVIEDLQKKNIKVTTTLGDKKGVHLIIRTHGVTPQEKAKIERSLASICDVTCPRVSKVQNIIDKYANTGYSIVIIGDSDHPEVKALIGYSNGRGFVINRDSDLRMLKNCEKLCVVSQTTMDQRKFDDFSGKVKKSHKNVVVFNTICDSTSKRQQEVLELCKKVDAMIVIGGKNSANTTKLAEISEEAGVKAYHIETEKELNLDELSGFEAVGVTGGASTPEWMINRILDVLNNKNNKVK